MADLRLVRTKTGSKVHLALKGFSRTLCGVRHVGPVKYVTPLTRGCGGCGLPSELTPEIAKQWLP